MNIVYLYLIFKNLHTFIDKAYRKGERSTLSHKKASWCIALATFLCILSPVTLIVLTMLSELPDAIVSEATAGVIGLTTLFAFILCAVPIYIYCDFKNQPYEFLDKNIPFELEYGVKGLVTEKKNAFRPTYIAYNIIATCLCVFSAVPLVY